jgi:hypothetical protein
MKILRKHGLFPIAMRFLLKAVAGDSREAQQLPYRRNIVVGK